MADNMQLLVRISADAEQYAKGMEDAAKATSKQSDAIDKSLAGVNSSLKQVGQTANQQGGAISRIMGSAGQSISRLAKSSYFGRLTGDIIKLRKESQFAWQQMSTLEKTASRMQKIGGVVAGVVAGAYALKEPVKKTMAYEHRLATLANTAYAEQGKEGRIKGMGELDAIIQKTVREGGGTRESAIDTLENLLASGAISETSAYKLLPTLQKLSTGTGADPNELGNIAIRAMQTFGIKEDELPLALDMAIRAGEAGGFELKDMAKWLPQQMAAASNIGMSGLSGFGLFSFRFSR